jgi:hypothetical protein
MIMSPATADDQYWAFGGFYIVAISLCGAGTAVCSRQKVLWEQLCIFQEWLAVLSA